jgi:outer membrane protein
MRFFICGFTCFGLMSAFAQSGAVQLKLADAEAMALKNHPQVLAAQNETLAQGRRIVEARSAYFPSVNGEITGSGANYGGRIGAGFLTDSRLFDRFGSGIEINQLISDFGRTSSLVSQAKLETNASEQNFQAARFDVLLRVNQAYYGVLRSQALVKIAQKTVDARQTQATQVAELARNSLRSQLDVSFADLTVSRAKLLLIRYQNMVQAAFAELTRALGAQKATAYALVDEPMPPSPGTDVEALVTQALQNRPELAAFRLTRDAAYRFEAAERDLKRPTASFIGVTGYMPYIDQITPPHEIPNEYAGAAVSVQIPIFNGHLFTARREEAHYRAVESDQRIRDVEDSISRDVRNAWGEAETAYQGLAVTAEFLREATMAQDLAQGRYQLQLASIVELTDAELNLTEAQIENLNAKYDYQSLYAALQYSVGALR